MGLSGDSDLPQVVGALNPSCRFTRHLHRGQEELYQQAQYRDDNKQFDERKAEWP
jgi:hypothetical protein